MFGSGSGTSSASGDDPQPPRRGLTGRVLVKGGSGTNHGGILAIGFKEFSLPIQGWGTLYINPSLFIPIQLIGPIPARGTTQSFQIPNSTVYLGANVYFQGVIARATRTELTNGVRWTIGM